MKAGLPFFREFSYNPWINKEIDPINTKEYQVSDGIEFLYDPKRKLFVLGPYNQSITEEQLEMGIADRIWKDGTQPLGQEYLTMSINGLIELPDFRKKLSQIAQDEKKKKKVAKETINVMRDVFTRHFNFKNVDTSSFFRVSLGENGDFNLNTFGDCSCLGVFPESTAVLNPVSPYDDLDLPVGYSIHNIDNPAQRISLLAGAGALAWIAKNEA